MSIHNARELKEKAKTGLYSKACCLVQTFEGRDTVKPPTELAFEMTDYYFGVFAPLIDMNLITEAPVFSLRVRSSSRSIFGFVWKRKGWLIKVEVIEMVSISVIAVLETGSDDHSFERTRKVETQKEAFNVIIQGLQIMDMISDFTLEARNDKA